MSAWLLDGNVLVAWAIFDHPHHERIRRWQTSVSHDQLATCPITEGTLLRLHMQYARDKSAAAAWAVPTPIHTHPRHVFWQDNFSYGEIDPARLTGHRQITVSWLAELARRKGGKLATLDLSLSVLWPDVTVLVPV
ncbi:MAG TPA: VapC toxin family PIN domain ribonuclease [Chthoniobacterales bacterium]